MSKGRDIRVFGTVVDSIVDGPGLRYAVFVQGCTHKCPGCHNPESQPAEGGTLMSIESIVADIQANKLIQGVTLSGGEPFEQPEACAELAHRLKELGYNIWVYSGYLYEDLLRMAGFQPACGEESPTDGDANAVGALDSVCAFAKERHGASAASERAQAVRRLLECADVLVDGPFVESLKSLGLKWRGSSNQRVIDVPATRKAGRIVKWEAQETFPTKPPSW